MSRLWRRLASFFHRERLDRELQEEMRFHLEMKAQELGDAYRARRAFGNPMWLKEVSREMWSWTSVERLVQDLRYGLRVLRRNPGFTTVVVLTLALGIGANTTVFSLFNAILLRDLPVKEPHRLVNFGPDRSFSYPDYLDFRGQSQAFEGVCAYYPASASLSGEGTPERVQGEVVTASYFSVLGAQPKLGRAFLPAEDQAPAAVVVLSHGLWVRRFGADPGTVGKTVTINSDTYTVVGIAPAGFQGARRGLTVDFWAPMSMAARIMPWAAEAKLLTTRDQRGFLIHGRLKPGVTREQALAQVNLISDRIQQLSGLRRRNPVYLETAGKLPGRVGEQFISWTAILLVVVGLLLLIACANVANLLLARALSRKREIGIRLAIGASRARVMRQLLTESILLSVLGAAAGVLLSLLATAAVSRGELPLPYQFSWELALDARVFAFTAALAIIAGMAFGLAPGLRATRADLVGALKDDGGPSRGMRPGGLRDLLVVVQVALSLVLLLGAGLFLRSLRNLLAIDPGFRPENLLVMQVEPRLEGYTTEKSIELLRQIQERVSTLPGVRSMSLTSIVPLSGFSSGSGFRVVGGKDDATRQANVVLVGPRYFETMGIPLLRGRSFDRETASGNPVVVINETLAKRFFPGEDPLGRGIRGGYFRKVYEVIGVVRDSKSSTIWEEPTPCLYEFLEQNPARSMFGMALLVKTAGDPGAMISPVREQVGKIDPNLPLFNVETMEEQVRKDLTAPRLSAMLFSVFGALGLLTAAVGLYGVMSYAVRCRTREIAIRTALGASTVGVLRMVIMQGMALAGAGTLIGFVISVASTRVVSSFLYGVSATDLVTFTAVPLALLAVAFVAIVVPARRATRIEPMAALRHE